MVNKDFTISLLIAPKPAMLSLDLIDRSLNPTSTLGNAVDCLKKVTLKGLVIRCTVQVKEMVALLEP